MEQGIARTTMPGWGTFVVLRARAGMASLGGALERWLEAERGQLFLWVPVMIGVGVISWFTLIDSARWVTLCLLALAVAMAGLALHGAGAQVGGGRRARVLLWAGGLVALGCVLAWGRAYIVAEPVLDRPAIVVLTGQVLRVEPQPARGIVRLRIAPEVPGGAGPGDGLPPVVRVNVMRGDLPDGVGVGAVVRMRARLSPPAPATVPGAYDFQRAAWFDGLGATGRGFAPVELLVPGAVDGGLRNRLTAHVHSRVAGSAGGIGAALVTGDRGAISDADAEALRRSGLAHLLSVSGLHVTAVVGAVMLLVVRMLGLSPTLAHRWPLPLIAAGVAGVAAVGYTLLTGAEVPTVRSCIAALMVLAAMMLGREALTLRLVAFGALIVLLLWPEALMGPSFQMSFAAVTAIVALYDSPRMGRWFGRREEGVVARLLRGALALLLTGLLVEIALTPIALFHFHKSGIYGALANIIAIPLTTFVVMPAEAAALALDAVGMGVVHLGAPFWWVAAQGLALLLWIAHAAADAPGALAMLPAMPGGAYCLMALGGLWLALWRTRVRMLGGVPVMFGVVWAVMTPAPDLLVTGDGRHLALRMADGEFALLRDRAGEYVRATLAETGGVDVDLPPLSSHADARCSPDFCVAQVMRGGRHWRIGASRSGYWVDWDEMIALCRGVDIMVSDRRLPDACQPRWLKLDRAALVHSGGVAITLGRTPQVTTVNRPGATHPWQTPRRVMPAR